MTKNRPSSRAAASPVNMVELPWIDPLLAAASWAHEPVMAFLDSAGPVEPRARWSYLAIDPFRVVEIGKGETRLNGRPIGGDPFALLAAELGRFPPPPAQPAPFAGGAVGFLGYELGRYCDRQRISHRDDLDIPEGLIGFYDTVLAFDRMEGRLYVLCADLGLPGRLPPAKRLAALRARLALAALAPLPPISGRWHPAIGRDSYCRRVERILRYIYAGDIFQANFTTRFLAVRPTVPAFALYRRLRAASPAPFAAFLVCGERLALACASPERFLRLQPDGLIETRPIKGTRPRHPWPAADSALAAELAASAKDHAENLMIVDLLRNDLGRVAVIGSVRVPQLCRVESFASVHHLVSAVQARLVPGRGAVDLLRAAFPGGSISGAPKLRAMEIIDELETCRRGPYCGAIVWIGFDGAMDSAITIRTLAITPAMVAAQAGGGIVADSDPEQEYEEMLVKIAPLLGALDGGVRAEGADVVVAERAADPA